MVQSKAKTVEEYLKELPEDRRIQISQVREVILKNLPDGYEEVMNWGMITYQVPLEVYPDTYNKQPLMYAALASQKNHMAVYLMSVYGDEHLRIKFEEDYKATGKKMDIGKSCVRFKNIDNLPLHLVGRAIAAVDLDSYIKQAQNAIKDRKK
jgi:hypothetical protein